MPARPERTTHKRDWQWVNMVKVPKARSCPTFSSYTTCEQERAAEFTASRFIYAQRDVEVARYKIARDGVQIIGVELHCLAQALDDSGLCF